MGAHFDVPFAVFIRALATRGPRSQYSREGRRGCLVSWRRTAPLVSVRRADAAPAPVRAPAACSPRLTRGRGAFFGRLSASRRIRGGAGPRLHITLGASPAFLPGAVTPAAVAAGRSQHVTALSRVAPSQVAGLVDHTLVLSLTALAYALDSRKRRHYERGRVQESSRQSVRRVVPAARLGQPAPVPRAATWGYRTASCSRPRPPP